MGSRVLFIRRFLQKLSPHPRLLHCSRLPPPLPSPRRVPILASESRANWCSNARALSYGSVNLVVSEEGKPRFETHEIDQPKKEKYRTKKRLKLQRKREKRKRKEANKKDPRNIAPKGKKKKDRFPSAEARIKYKIEKAKIKEGLLVEKLKRYEVPQLQGPEVKPENLTGEERFFLKKMSQKKSNYVQIGRRGIFGGVVLNMHLHWKKHETVKVICKPCKPGQVHEYAKDIARLSGGIPVRIIGNDTIIFYRGKNYVQPEVMSPIDTLSKKKALEKSKYEQSLETVRRFIAIAEKELELYYRHVALYGDPNTRNADMVYGDGRKSPKRFNKEVSALANDESVCSTGKDVLGGINNEEILSSSGDDLDIDLSDDESVGDSDDREFTEIETDSEDEVSSTKINSENAISIMQGVPISFIEK